MAMCSCSRNIEHSKYTFETSDAAMLFSLFNMYEEEAKKTMEHKLVFPAYDYVLKCSHTFNLLDARGAISVTERTGYITRVRNLARRLRCNVFGGTRTSWLPIA